MRISYSMNNFGFTTKFIQNVASSFFPIVTTSSVSPSLMQQPPRTGVTQSMFRSKQCSSRDTLTLGYQPHSVVRNGRGGKGLEDPGHSWCRCLSLGKPFQMFMSQCPPLKYGDDPIRELMGSLEATQQCVEHRSSSSDVLCFPSPFVM